MWSRVVGRIGPVIRIIRVFVGFFLGFFLCFEVFLLIGRIGVWGTIGILLILISLSITCVKPMTCIWFVSFVFERQVVVFGERSIELASGLRLQGVLIGGIRE